MYADASVVACEDHHYRVLVSDASLNGPTV